VSPRVQYETTCLLISDAIGNVSCSVAWGKAQYVTWIHMVQEGPEVREYLSTTSGARGVKTTACSDLLPLHQRKWDCVWWEWQHGGFRVTEMWWNHYTWVQGTNLSRVSNYYDSHSYGYKRSGILTGLVGFGLVMDENKSGWDLSCCESTLVWDLSWVMRLRGNPWSTIFNELIRFW
jgi:hypothetical protein